MQLYLKVYPLPYPITDLTTSTEVAGQSRSLFGWNNVALYAKILADVIISQDTGQQLTGLASYSRRNANPGSKMNTYSVTFKHFSAQQM